MFDLRIGEMDSEIQAAIEHGVRTLQFFPTEHGMIFNSMHDMPSAMSKNGAINIHVCLCRTASGGSVLVKLGICIIPFTR